MKNKIRETNCANGAAKNRKKRRVSVPKILFFLVVIIFARGFFSAKTAENAERSQLSPRAAFFSQVKNANHEQMYDERVFASTSNPPMNEFERNDDVFSASPKEFEATENNYASSKKSAETEKDSASSKKTEDTEKNSASSKKSEDTEKNSHTLALNVSLHSTNALLMDFHSGDVLYSQNGTEKIFPASLVKMMTALVALENIRDLNEEVFLHEKIFAPIHNANATTAGFPPNDSVRAMDLLYGLLLPSGAECAIGLAVHVAGSEKNFVEKMNARAKEIGMNATNFANTTGLHDDAQVSTAMDMAILLRHALENEMFYRIVSAPRHSTAGTRLRPDGITVQSTLFSRMNGAEFSDGKILGGRTGFTNQSGQNLASFAEIKGSKYILVTSGAQTNGNHLTQTLHIDDAFLVYNAVNLASR